MSIAFVVGNGVSRKPINVGLLPRYGMVYGCNALYRDMTPTVLVATDAPISKRIQEEGYALHNRFHTRNPISGLGAKPLSSTYRNFCSGANAFALACMEGHNTIYIVGFDFGSVTDKFNNMYAETEFYKTNNCSATSGSQWIKQFATIAKDFPNTKVVRVVSETSVLYPEFDELYNVSTLPILNFVNGLNTR